MYLKEIYRKIKGWYYHQQDRLSRIFNLLPTIWNIYDFDYSSCLELEYKQLLRIKKCMENPGKWAYEGIEEDIHKLEVCIKLLKMILDEESGYYNNDKFNHYVNLKNYRRFTKCKISENMLAFDLLKEDLYLLKAWHLYNKMRTHYMRTWWV